MEFERAGRGVWGGQGRWSLREQGVFEEWVDQGRWSLREQGGVFGGAKGGGV